MFNDIDLRRILLGKKEVTQHIFIEIYYRIFNGGGAVVDESYLVLMSCLLNCCIEVLPHSHYSYYNLNSGNVEFFFYI